VLWLDVDDRPISRPGRESDCLERHWASA
jgi:hypothetical protein